VYGTTAGLQLIGELDLPAVEEHVRSLVEYARERLTAQGERLWLAADPKARGAHLGLVASDASMLAGWLAQRDITVSPRGSVVRLSFHYYNDSDDVDRLCAALQDFRTAHE
jgi:selenocysteine lyase/cysteine desulfurase